MGLEPSTLSNRPLHHFLQGKISQVAIRGLVLFQVQPVVLRIAQALGAPDFESLLLSPSRPRSLSLSLSLCLSLLPHCEPARRGGRTLVFTTTGSGPCRDNGIRSEVLGGGSSIGFEKASFLQVPEGLTLVWSLYQLNQARSVQVRDPTVRCAAQSF